MQSLQNFFLILIVLFIFNNNIVTPGRINPFINKMDPFYLQKKLSETEKMLGETVQNKKNIKNDFATFQDLQTVHQGIVCKIDVYVYDNLNEKAPFKYIFTSLKTENSRIKTESSISIGLTKITNIKLQDNQNSTYHNSKWFACNENKRLTNSLLGNLRIDDVKASKLFILTWGKGNEVPFELVYDRKDSC